MNDRPTRAPNLLFVFADQMRGFDMGCAGNADVHTPNLDRLAREGAMVTRAYANCPVCTPSRAMLLTGRYPLSNRVLANDLPLPEDVPTLGERLKGAGYRTGYVGKWHLDGVPRDRRTPPGPRRHGFDDLWAVWNCSHDYYRARYYRDDDPEPVRVAGYEPVAQTDLALEFIQTEDPREGAPAARPFCLFLSYGPPHDPYDQVPPEHAARYAPERVALRGNVAELKTDVNDPARRAGPRLTLSRYYAAITALDEQVGRLLDALDRRGLAENTVVVFTSDHGDMLFSQGMLKKQQPYEESVRIPFLIRWPGRVPAGSRPDVLLSVADFAPTLLSLLGVGPGPGMEGADLSGALLGRARGAGGGNGPESVFLLEMVTTDEGEKQRLRPWRGVRTRRHTYARWHDGAPWLLFDNDDDPLQKHNRVDDPAYADVRARLERELEAWLRRTGDRSLPQDDLLREQGLVALWNARERELRPAAAARLL